MPPLRRTLVKRGYHIVLLLVEFMLYDSSIRPSFSLSAFPTTHHLLPLGNAGYVRDETGEETEDSLWATLREKDALFHRRPQHAGARGLRSSTPERVAPPGEHISQRCVGE